jgi:DNA-binding MarR family transcriptional regulator
MITSVISVRALVTPATIAPMTELLKGTDVAEDLNALVSRLHHLLRRAATGTPPDLPEAHVQLLWLVRRHPGISVSEAADSLRTAANTVSTRVGDLAEAGLLTRTRDPGNRRVVRLDLTPEASRRLGDYMRRRQTVLAEALARLDPPALATLAGAVQVLRRVEDLLGRRL